MKNIIILHEYGSPNHFRGLVSLLNQKGIGYSFYELNWWSKIKKGIKQGSFPLIYRGIRNFVFLQILPFLSRRKVILSIAPYNPQMVSLRRKLKRHQSFFFISYTIWDQSMFVHDYYGDENVLAEWREFLLEDTTHIFAVSEKTKSEMVKNNFAVASKVSVVYHSYKIRINPLPVHDKTNSFISVGGLTASKGTEELLKIFANRPELQLTLVGEGDLKALVLEYCKNCPNIIYKGFIKDQRKLFSLYQESSFLLLNSHRTKTWEELFGMVLIEGSACGLIPVATDHSGPKEIITDGINGFICDEGSIIRGIERCIALNSEQYISIRAAAIENGSRFYVERIAKRWESILL